MLRIGAPDWRFDRGCQRVWIRAIEADSVIESDDSQRVAGRCIARVQSPGQARTGSGGCGRQACSEGSLIHAQSPGMDGVS